MSDARFTHSPFDLGSHRPWLTHFSQKSRQSSIWSYSRQRSWWVGWGILVSLCPSVCLSVCRPNGVRSVFFIILVGSISYLHILSTNFRRCVACRAVFRIPQFDFCHFFNQWLSIFWPPLRVRYMRNHLNAPEFYRSYLLFFAMEIHLRRKSIYRTKLCDKFQESHDCYVNYITCSWITLYNTVQQQPATASAACLARWR